MAANFANHHYLETLWLVAGVIVGLYVWGVVKVIVEAAIKTCSQSKKPDWETYEIPATPPTDQAGRDRLLIYAPQKVAPRGTVLHPNGYLTRGFIPARIEVFNLAKVVANGTSPAQAQAALDQIHQLVARFPAPPSTPAPSKTSRRAR